MTMTPVHTGNMRAKIRAYEQRVREVEHGSFTPLVMSLTGGCGNAASVAYKRLASMLAEKRDQPYSTTLSSMRRKLSFALLRSSIQCIRGHALVVAEPSFSLFSPLTFYLFNFFLIFLNFLLLNSVIKIAKSTKIK